MIKVDVKPNEMQGKIKPMHAVNNGPAHKWAKDQQISNLEAFKEAGIPYMRNHDAAFYATYGGEHCVDIHAIFPNFDKDPYDEASYDFPMTDYYLKVMYMTGGKAFYRLGAKIEHGVKKYGTLPPKDFKKWAVICEHIIRHYTEGWADGFEYDLEYWEIWNEPDLDPDDAVNKRTWGGTKAQFFDLFEIAAKHLKGCFPHLKIGGPAIAGNDKWAEDFLFEMKKRNTPIDFFSWHIYAYDPKWVVERTKVFKNLLLKSGYENAESILNEWNYVKGWEDDNFVYSVKSIKGLKGSAFTASTMLKCQPTTVDMLMYYDARPCGFNGMFATDIPSERLKGYYPFKMFNELYKLQNCIKTESENDAVSVCGAVSNDGKNVDVMLSYFDDNDNAPSAETEIFVDGFSDAFEAEIYVLDEEHNFELLKKEVVSAEKIVINMPLYSTYLIKLKKN